MLLKFGIAFMKSNVATLLSLLLLAVIPFFGQNPQPYPFAQYPAPAPYKGKPAPPKLTTRSQREFRTVLRQGAQKGHSGGSKGNSHD